MNIQTLYIVYKRVKTFGNAARPTGRKHFPEILHSMEHVILICMYAYEFLFMHEGMYNTYICLYASEYVYTCVCVWFEYVVGLYIKVTILN
jgi:hypothetical protein